MPSAQLPYLRLKKNEERRLLSGHLWVFSNEVDVAATPLTQFAPGAAVVLETSRGQALGVAYVNPATLICARLLSRASDQPIDREFFATRLRQADALRRRCFDGPYYRLVYGESDGLPGLVVDRYGDVYVVQISTAGMEQRIALIVEAMVGVFAPRAIVLKNTSSLRELEGLPTYTEIAAGALTGLVRIEENTRLFWIDPLSGQKTGWFFDHRDNRGRWAPLTRGGRVLDLFGYSGAWSIQALAAGAVTADCVDSSESALALARENAALNGVVSRLHTVTSDVFEFLKGSRADGRRYDAIVIDPPALIKRRKDYQAGIEAYSRLNNLARQLLNPAGILVSCSCSHHLPREVLHGMLTRLGSRDDPPMRLVAQGGQAADHPVHPAIPETAYLKALFCWFPEPR